MDFSVLTGSQGHNPFTAGLNPVRSRLAHVARRKSSTRAERNAYLRSVLKKNSLPEDARKFQEENPNALGLPRSYKIAFHDVPAEDREAIAELDGSCITFSHFGHDLGRIVIDSHVIEPQHAAYNPSLNSYTFSAPVVNHKQLTKDYTLYQAGHLDGKLAAEDVAAAPVESVSGYLNFNPAEPMGTLFVAGNTFNVTLAPEPLMFNVDVSANAGAYWSTADAKLKWNTDSPEWKSATWEVGKMQFGYDVATEIDPATGKPLSHVENVFIDTLPKIPEQFKLKYDKYGTMYTSLMDGRADPSGPTMQTTVTSTSDVPTAPSERKGNTITSVFPQLCTLKFSPFGDTFAGAYKDRKGNVYSVRGAIVVTGRPTALLRALSKPSKALHAYNVTPLDIQPKVKAASHPAALLATPATAATAASPNDLVITTLLGMSPMVADSKDPSGYRDDVASEAMDDFHNIIAYYMDDDLRQTFIGSKPQLDPRVKTIADDDTANSAFYKKLHTPYLAAFLGASPSDDGTTQDAQKHINVVRAQRMLQEIPADDPVYQRHSQKLYTLRFNDKFDDIKSFTADQRDKDYNTQIDSIATYLMNDLKNQAKSFPGDSTDPKWPYKEDLDKSLQDIDSLAKWAKDKRLYWAMYLIYYVQKTMLPNWYAQQTTGALSSSVGMQLKTLNGVFGLLEGNETNKNGPSFMQAFNQLVRLFQMSSIVPQLVDATGATTDIDDTVKECLFQFIQLNKDTTDPEIMKQLAIAQDLYKQADTRRNFIMVFAEAQRLLGSMATWANITTMFMQTVRTTTWFTRLNKAAETLSLMAIFISVAMLSLPILLGGFERMTPQEKTLWGLALGRVTSTIIIAVMRGAIRLNYFWSDVAGMGDKFQLFVGRGKFMEDLLKTSPNRISNSMARYFMKPGDKAKAAEQGSELLVREGEELPQTDSLLAKMFGRNIDELMGTVFGVIMSIVTIVLVSIDLAKEDNPLMTASDAFMVASAAVQVLAIAAGWVVAAFTETSAIFGFQLAFSAVELVATWGGPVGIVLAIVGVIIFILWNALQDRRSPLEKFVDDYVKNAGLYMRYTAVDYISNIAPNQTRGIELVGLSIKPQTLFRDTISPAMYAYTKTPASVDANPSLDLEGALTHSINDIWSIDTDGSGKTYFTAACYFPPVTKPDGTTTGDTVLFYNLSVKADGSGLELVQQPRKGDKDYDAIRKRMQWTVTTVAEPTLAPSSTNSGTRPDPVKPVSALVMIQQGEKTLVPMLDGDGKATSLTLTPTVPIFQNFMASWLLEMQPMGPGTLKYRHNPWQLVTTDTDERNFPTFKPSIGSRGMVWAVTPALDEPFELVSGSGSSNSTQSGDEGSIRMKKGTKFSGPMPKKDYTVTCTLKISGFEDIVRSVPVSIQVDKAEIPDNDN